MKRIAIIGGGIAGLSAAYYLEKARRAGASLQWVLFEKSDRLGGAIETERRDGFVIEAVESIRFSASSLMRRDYARNLVWAINSFSRMMPPAKPTFW